MAGPWRLIVEELSDGAWNMAVDEAMLESCTGPGADPGPTLRLYGWSRPTVSLGNRQPAAGAHDPAFLRRNGIALVRRPTGGAAILHEHERTYSVVGRLRSEWFPGGVLDTYRQIADAMMESFRRLGLEAVHVHSSETRGGGPAGPPGCFDLPSAHEISVRGRKVIGSAQYRRKDAFLQHGSILVRVDPARYAAALGVAVDGRRFAGLERLLGRCPGRDELDAALVEGFGRAFGASLEEREISALEAEMATRLRCWKYESASWTLEGRFGPRERRWGPPLPTS